VRCIFLTLPLLLAFAPVASAQTIYRHVDENGVVSFSDVETEGSEPVEIQVPVVREDSRAEQQALIDQQLSVAKALEESRLAREDARTRRMEALAAVQPTTVYHREADRTRYVGGRWGYWGGPGWPGHPGKPEHPIEPPVEPPPERPPGRPVPLLPLNGSGH
jgi:hypothetical protein